MLIRDMLQEDIPQVAQIEKASFSQPWSEKSFQDSIAREDTIFLVSEKNGIITGYIGMYVSFEEADVTNVAVAPEYRKKGYGEALVSAIIERARQKQIENIFLEVRISNFSAISLYEKLKFEHMGVRKNFYQYPQEDAVLMCCKVDEV